MLTQTCQSAWNHPEEPRATDGGHVLCVFIPSPLLAGLGTVACPAVLSLAGPSRTHSGHIARTGRAPVPTVLGPGQAPPAAQPSHRAFRRSRGRTRFSASPLISGRGICEYPCCAFLSRSWTRVVALPSILRICPGPPLLAASHSDLTGATRSPWWFFILRVFRCRKGKPVLLKIKDLTKGLAFCDSLENGNFAQGLRDVFTH